MGKSGLFWTPFVFVRYVLFLAIGIIAGVFFIEDYPAWWFFIFCLLLSVGLIVLFIFKHNQHKLSLGLLSLLILFTLGMMRVKMSHESTDPLHIINQKDTIVYYTVKIDYFFQEREKVWKTIGQIKQVKTKKGWQQAIGKVQLYFFKKNFDTIPFYGDQLLIQGQPQVLEKPRNPGEFNIKQYLSFKQIYHQHFIRKENHFGIIQSDVGNPVIYYALKMRQWADGILKQNFHQAERLEIMRALVLGVTDGIDEDISQAYAAAGAMHVLAVSGMHVTILYTLLIGLAKPLGKKVTHGWWLAIVSLIIMWTYAFITGWSPSVMRSAVMISIMVFSKPLKRKGNVFNAVALSAFVLLLWDPFMLMSVGFQLSYLAVLGIIIFQKPIYRLYEPRTYMGDQIWKVCAVSIAAQLATLPLGLLYFHQFPVYFIFSNLIVIPVSTIALVGGLACLAFSFSDLLMSGLVWITDFMILIMNASVRLVEILPGSVIDNIYINIAQSWLLLSLLFGLWMWWEHKLKFGAWLLAGTFSCLLLVQLEHELNFRQTDLLVIHAINNQTSVEHFQKGKSIWYRADTLTTNKSALRMHIAPGRLRAGVSPNSIQHFALSQNNDFTFIQHHNKIVAIVNRKPKHWPNFKVDYYLISHQAVLPKHIPESQQDAVFLLDASNKVYFTKLFEREASKRKLQYLILHQSLTL
ncbi:MAG: ComEC/Rec2 family competence protein [Cyclobacteriaceae bacterium]|nr:ComEC/Rec2 family competence protein [Cyclobacteriaceae bacterium]